MGFIRVGTALTFALTPFWPSGMLSTLGMPLALWAFMHIRKGRRSWKEYLFSPFFHFTQVLFLAFSFFYLRWGFFG